MKVFLASQTLGYACGGKKVLLMTTNAHPSHEYYKILGNLHVINAILPHKKLNNRSHCSCSRI